MKDIQEVRVPRFILLLVLLLPMHPFAQTMQDQQQGTMPAADAGVIVLPTQPGQSAFAAIQEIVAILLADPATDWSKVNINVLRRHLIDMDNVTLHAAVRSETVDGGLRFNVSGTGAVRGSIQRMVTAHAAAMNRTGGWQYRAEVTPAGAIMTVTTPAADAAKLRALGFIGVMAIGMHHPAHHLMIARGGHPHP